MMTNTRLICLKTPPKRINNPVYIGRGSKWGNPFIIGRDGDRKTVVEKFRRHLWRNKELLAQLPELKGTTMMCFCRNDEECHGEVLLSALVWLKEQEKKAAAADARDGEHEQREAANQRLADEFAGDHATQCALALHDAC